MYTTKGTLVAASYSAVCSECKAVLQHSSWTIQAGDEKKEFFFDPSDSRYFQCTAMTVFETKLIDSVTQQILHSGVTFESQASVYNALHGENDEKRFRSVH